METILMEISGETAVVTLNRPHCLNALNGQLFQELEQCMMEIEKRGDIKVVILTGAGEKAFAAGADIAAMVDMSVVEGRAFDKLIQEVGMRMENMPQIIIAAVNGFALGGGCELALCCDIRVASENAKFALPETGLGIIPGGGGTQRLPKLIGQGRAMEMIVTGKQIDAQEAWRVGLVNQVVPQAELMDTCRKMAGKICSKGSYANALAKRAVKLSGDTDLKSGLAAELELISVAFATKDRDEGMKAFLEKRKPNFQGC